MDNYLIALGGLFTGLAALLPILLKLRKRHSDPDLASIIKHNDFFANAKRAVRYDIPQMFDLARKKDAQFYLLMICKFTVYNNNLKVLARKVLAGTETELSVNQISDLHYAWIGEYTDLFIRLGGSEHVAKVFNKWHNTRAASIIDMIRQFFVCEAFTYSPQMKMIIILSVYNLIFFMALGDLHKTYQAMNGTVDKECSDWDPALSLEALRKVVVFDEHKVTGGAA